MSKLCVDCPHLKRGEGGGRAATEALRGAGRFRDAPHPCHNAPTTPCRGHVRELELVRSGAAEYNGDTVSNTYKVNLPGGVEIEGEFSPDEIKVIRYGTEAERAAALRGCPVPYTLKTAEGVTTIQPAGAQ